MSLLAIESSADLGSVALKGPQGLACQALSKPRDHARKLAATLAGLVKSELGGDFAQITRYAVTIGPGSFTGLRIGIALLKGLWVINPRPVITVSTLALWAMAADDAADGPVLSVMDARNGQVFAGLYHRQNGRLEADPRLPDGLYEALALSRELSSLKAYALGDGLNAMDLGAMALTPVEAEATAATLIALVEGNMAGTEACDLPGLEPRYLQLAAAEAARSQAKP